MRKISTVLYGPRSPRDTCLARGCLGPRFQALYNGEDLSGKMVYLALVCLDFVGDLQYDYSLSNLRAALVPRKYDEATGEAS